ncbi:MAG: hypothetical protein R2705_24590 [Ilumatobacteraceae bacterium]
MSADTPPEAGFYGHQRSSGLILGVLAAVFGIAGVVWPALRSPPSCPTASVASGTARIRPSPDPSTR